MYDLRGCRACLNQNCKLERISDTARRIYCTVTGLDFTPGDCYPSYFCAECSTQIKKILAFRRRCRRAFFVLKEIVTVREKVSLADLAIVDRKKTNLTSNIDYWKNNNTGFYSVIKVEETDTKPSDIREFLTDFEPNRNNDIIPNHFVDTVKYKPEVFNNTFIAVDIKPNSTEYDNDEVEYKSDNEVDIKDDMGEDEAGDEGVPDIDYDDVFKGLPEEKNNEDSDYSLPELQEPQPKKSKVEKNEGGEKKETKMKKPCIIKKPKAPKNDCGMQRERAFNISRTLVDFKIQVLSLEEQIAAFQARKEAEPYKSAGFKCSMCLVVFTGMPDLIKHVQEHNDKQKKLGIEQRRKHQCAVCKDAFGSQSELTVHSACSHWYKYTCKECNLEKYTLWDTLMCHNRPPISMSRYYTMEEAFHMRDMTSQAPLMPMERNCCFCGWRVSKSGRVQHEKEHVEPAKFPTLRSYQCDMCGLWCRLKVYLECHMQTHYRIFSCKFCDKVFEGWNAAHDHLKDHIKFRCTFCQETFRSDLERRKHHIKHKLDFKLDCNVCGVAMHTLCRLYYHQLIKHGYISIIPEGVGDPKYRCATCDVQFVDEASLQTHKMKRGHLETGRVGGKCHSCRKIFFTVEDFVAHRRGNKVCKRYPVKCVYCDEMLTNYRASERHYEHAHPDLPNEHQNAMLYTVCEYCGKTLAQQHIKAHLKRHTTPGGEPELACKFCSSKMFTSRAFVSHVLFNHTPKPYMCTQCPYRAKYRSECREHILKVHAPELLYSCQKCTRRFSHLDLLQSHSVKAHGISVKEDRSVFLSMKNVLGKIYVFPHMKIDGSFIPHSVIEDAGLYLYDYLCKSHKLVDWRDYYVFGTGVEPISADPYVHRKRKQKKIYNKEKKKVRRKPVDEVVLKALESQHVGVAVMPEVKKERGRKRIYTIDSDVGHDKVKIAKLDETSYCDEYADDDKDKHEEIVQRYVLPDLQAAILGKPSAAVPYSNRNKPQKRHTKKPVVVIENQIVNNDNAMINKSKETSHCDENVDVHNVEHEETVQGYDMPDLQAEILGEPSEVKADDSKEETAEEEYEELDMAQLISENYEVIEENGEQYVMMNGNLYKVQIG